MIRRTSSNRKTRTSRKTRRTVVTGLAAVRCAVLVSPQYGTAQAATPTTRPVDTKSADTKSADTKSADTKSGTSQRTVRKLTLSRVDDPGPAPERADTLKERRAPSIITESTRQGERRYQLSERLQGHRVGTDAGTDAEAAPRATPDIGATADINDCMNADDAYDRAGLVVDHFFYCQAGYYTVTNLDCILGDICWTVGEAWFRLTTIGRGEVGDREVSFVTLMDRVGRAGDTSGFVIRNTMDCYAYAGAICEADPDNGRSDLLADWQNVPSAVFRFSSPLTGASGRDDLSWYDFRQEVALSGPTRSTWAATASAATPRRT